MSPRLYMRSPIDRSPSHLILEIGETCHTDPLVASALGVLVTGGIAFVLDIGSVELRELYPARGTVVVVPFLAPTNVRLKLQPYAPEVVGIVEPPLIFWIAGHRTCAIWKETYPVR